MQVSDFDYPLPDRLIAQFPPEVRGNSRLLHVDGLNCHDDHFSQLIHYLRPGDVLVFNDTRVLKARLFGQKLSGGQVEVLVERVLDSQQVLAHVRASKSPKPGSRLLLEGRWEAEMVERQNELFRLRFTGDTPVLDILDASGKLPLPPYITRQLEDQSQYQTVYAKELGSAAAPTAGLHFTPELLDTIRAKGVNIVEVTLHVGQQLDLDVALALLRGHFSVGVLLTLFPTPKKLRGQVQTGAPGHDHEDPPHAFTRCLLAHGLALQPPCGAAKRQTTGRFSPSARLWLPLSTPTQAPLASRLRASVLP